MIKYVLWLKWVLKNVKYSNQNRNIKETELSSEIENDTNEYKVVKKHSSPMHGKRFTALESTIL